MLCCIMAGLNVSAQGTVTSQDIKRITDECMQTQLQWRDLNTGVWETAGWWNSANVLTALIQYAKQNNRRDLWPVIDDVFEKSRHYKVGEDDAGNPRYCDDYANDFYDDRGWWALAWVDAYLLTSHAKYLNMAETIFRGMTNGWTDDLGGGIYWKRNPHQYKNAIANNLFGLLAARLLKHTGKAEYRDWLMKETTWMLNTGMLNDQYMVEDGLQDDGTPNRNQYYTYNQGVLMAVLTELYELTREQRYLTLAEGIAQATLENMTTADGVLREIHENTEPSGDGVQFKGIFVRHLSYLHRVAPKDRYRDFFRTNAQSIVTRDYDAESHSLGCFWYGPFHKVQSAANACALECLIAFEGCSNDSNKPLAP